MVRKVLSALAALCVLAGLGFVTTHGAQAAPVKAATVSTQELSTTVRALCIKRGTGEPRSLWVVEATGLCPEPYWGPASLEDAFGIVLPKAPAAAKPPATAPAGDEVAPVLSINATPSATGVSIKWKAAAPPSDDTISGYEYRYRVTSVLTWTGPFSAGNVLSKNVAGLVAGTQYFFQVRAVYATTDAGRGPWSNTLTATTDAL